MWESHQDTRKGRKTSKVNWTYETKQIMTDDLHFIACELDFQYTVHCWGYQGCLTDSVNDAIRLPDHIICCFRHCS